MEQQTYQYPASAGYEETDGKADLLDKIKPERAVEIIKNTLMGNEWDAVEEKWVANPHLKEYAVTEVGAAMIAALIYPACSQNTSLSNLKEDRINKRLLGLLRALNKDMLDYWTEMGIKTTAQLGHISNIVQTLVWVSLTQSENEGIRRLLNSTIQENRSVSTYSEAKKSGGISGLLRR